MSPALQPLTDETFARTIRDAPRPVVVDFGATFCPPCKALQPVLERLAGERHDVLWTYVNVEESPETAMAFGIRATPTLLLFREGRPIGQLTGHQSRDRLERWLAESLG